MNKGNFILLQFLISCSKFSLHSQTNFLFHKSYSSFQFSFNTKQITIDKFLIQIDSEHFPVHWKFEGSNDNFVETNKWETIFEMKNQQCSQRGINIFVYDSNNHHLFSSFRFTMIGKTL
jgi:hypothetical protein